MEHLFVFATFLKDIVCANVFLGLLEISDGKKDVAVIFDILLTNMKQWSLDLERFVDVGSDGATIMLAFRNRVAAKLKREVNPFHAKFLFIALLIEQILLHLMLQIVDHAKMCIE